MVTSQLGVLNLQMAQAAPTYRNADVASIQPLSADLDDTTRLGYATRSVTEQRWARQYFGADSRWHRFVLESQSADIPTVWADVIDTDSLASLRTHSAMSCYRFHQQDVRSRRTIAAHQRCARRGDGGGDVGRHLARRDLAATRSTALTTWATNASR